MRRIERSHVLQPRPDAINFFFKNRGCKVAYTEMSEEIETLPGTWKCQPPGSQRTSLKHETSSRCIFPEYLASAHFNLKLLCAVCS